MNYIFSWKWLQKWWNVIGYFDRFDLILTKYEKRVVVEFTIRFFWRLKQNMTRNMTKLLTVHPTKYFLQSSQKLMKSTNLNIYTPLASMKNHDNWRIFGNSGKWFLFWLSFLTVLLDNTFFEFPAQNTFPPILLRDYFKTTFNNIRENSKPWKKLKNLVRINSNQWKSFVLLFPVVSSMFKDGKEFWKDWRDYEKVSRF